MPYPLTVDLEHALVSYWANSLAGRALQDETELDDSPPPCPRSTSRRYARARDSERGRARWMFLTVEPFYVALRLRLPPWAPRWIRSA